MRNALNKNPMAQIGFVALLAIGVAFLLMTRVVNRDSGSEATPTTPTATAGTPAPAGSPPAPVAGADAVPVAPAAPATPDALAQPEPAATEFVAGPGLPAKVVSAYAAGDTVVLLFSRKEGIDDGVMRRTVERFGGDDGVAFFDVLAKDIAEYSRVTQAVEVDRVPALIVLSPRSISGDVPSATVEYGFRGPGSVQQAIADAGYKGKEIPYFPE